MKKLVLFLISSCVTLAAGAQGVPSLLIGADPQGLAMGSATIARGADAFALDNNAAAMSLSDKEFAVAASYGIWAPGTAGSTLASVGTWYRLGDKFALGLSGKMLQDKPYDITSPTGQISGTFSPYDILGGLGASYAVTESISLGVTGRFVSSAIADNMKGSAFGADISAMYSSGALSAGLGLCNVGSSISYGGASYSLPMLVRGGGAYSTGAFIASAEVDYLLSGALMAGLGAEYCVADIVSVRAGYHYGDAAKAVPSYLSLGLGAEFAGVSLDLAYLTASETLGNTVLFGIGFSF